MGAGAANRPGRGVNLLAVVLRSAEELDCLGDMRLAGTLAGDHRAVVTGVGGDKTVAIFLVALTSDDHQFGDRVLDRVEAAVGGPLAIVQDGDLIEIDVPGRRLELLVSGETIERRLAEWTAPEPPVTTGFLGMYARSVGPANRGAVMS